MGKGMHAAGGGRSVGGGVDLEVGEGIGDRVRSRGQRRTETHWMGSYGRRCRVRERPQAAVEIWFDAGGSDSGVKECAGGGRRL